MSQVAEEQVDDLELEHESAEGFEENLDTNLEEDPERVELEARASRMGWSPKDQWRGDADRWIEADEFLKRGEERMPILQERLRKQDETISKLQGSMRDVIKTQGDFERQTRADVEKEFEERKRAAVEEADTDAYDQVTKERREWEKDNPVQAEPKPDNGGEDPAFAAWSADNTWYGGESADDKRMTNYANSMGAFVKTDRPEVIGTPEFYVEIEKLVKKQFAANFENPNRRRPGAVESARGAQGARGKKTYADLPPTAKKMCDKYLERGDIADKDEYVTAYFEEGATQ